MGIVLAAGRGRRFGQPKAFVPWGQSSLVEHSVYLLHAIGLEAAVVLRDEHLDYSLDAISLVNLRADDGLATSVSTGLRWLHANFPGYGACLVLADQPFVRASDFKTVLSEFLFRAPCAHVVRPCYDGKPGHPVVLDASVIPSFLNLKGDRGLGPLLGDRHDVAQIEIAVGSRPHPAFDIDTTDDYQKAIQWLAQEGSAGGIV